jgi:DNA segregation ATPase FtsK/SpoIIIE, S-DNA-T family
MAERDRVPAVIEGTVVERLVHAKRHPVVPVWIRDDVTRRAAAKYAALHTAHLAAFHGARTPKYLVRTVAWSPRGLWRVARGLAGWALDTEAEELRSHTVVSKDAAAYHKLADRRDERVRRRVTILAAAVAGAAAGTVVADWLLWAYAWAAVCAAVVGLLGYAGRPYGRVFLDVASSTPRSERLTQDMVTRALGSLGIAQINAALKDGGRIDYTSIPHRDGPGWRVDVDLPYGVTAVDIIDRRDKLASGLRRPLACVWPEPADEEHAGRLVLLVLDEPMRDGKPVAWPLARGGQADLFTPVPFGTDQRGRAVALLLMFASVLIGAMPRMGKTFALRVLALGAALDPLARLRVWELKGTGDLSALEHVAHEYGSGADDATIEACLASVRQMYAELDSRAATIRGLPKDLCPESKVTPGLARRKSLGLFPEVLIIDECQEAFSHPQHGKEFDRLCTAIVKRGPALGIIALLATQRPDAASLPTGISANIGIRYCLRVMGQVENDMVLGTSSYKRGIRATEFTGRDKGIGYLSGHADDVQVVRSCYIDAVAADAIGRRARQLREDAGTLSGYAAGEQDSAPAVSLLEDVLAVTAGEERIWSETIAARLAELRPDFYRGWDAAAVGDALRVRGIEPAQQWGQTADGQGANRRGVTRQQIADAIAASGPAARSSGAASGPAAP